MLTTCTMMRHMLLESDNVPTDKLLYLGLTSNIYRSSFGSNLNLSLNHPVDLPVTLSLSIDM